MNINTKPTLRLFLTIGGVFLFQTLVLGYFFNACGIDPQKPRDVFKDDSKQQVSIQKPKKCSPWTGYSYAGMVSGALITACCIIATRDIFSR